MAAALVADIPEVESATRLNSMVVRPTLRNGEVVFAEEKVFAADSNFFQFFSFQIDFWKPGYRLKGNLIPLSFYRKNCKKIFWQ